MVVNLLMARRRQGCLFCLISQRQFSILPHSYIDARCTQILVSHIKEPFMHKNNCCLSNLSTSRSYSFHISSPWIFFRHLESDTTLLIKVGSFIAMQKRCKRSVSVLSPKFLVILYRNLVCSFTFQICNLSRDTKTTQFDYYWFILNFVCVLVPFIVIGVVLM